VADFKITRAAQADLRNIGAFGKERFGDRQAALYLVELRACCVTLGEHPNPGIPCPEQFVRLLTRGCGRWCGT
jgi:plasmid stabilization system protein ParE